MFAGQIAAVLPPPWTDAVRRRGREHNAKFIRGAKKTRRKNTDAMGDDATARIREFHFWKPARRRETRRRLRNAHRRKTRKHFKDARPALFYNLVIYISRRKNAKKVCVCPALNIWLERNKLNLSWPKKTFWEREKVKVKFRVLRNTLVP